MGQTFRRCWTISQVARVTTIPADYDVPQTFNLAYAWNLPWFASGQGIRGHIIKGWVISGFARAVAGTPVTILSGVDNSLSGYGDDFADQVGSPALPGGRGRVQQINKWFNTQAFTVNALGTYGDSRRGGCANPGRWHLGHVLLPAVPTW